VWDSQLLPAVHVGLIWNDQVQITGKAATQLPDQLIALVSRHLPTLDGHVNIAHPDPRWKQLPRHIAVIFISRPQWLDESTWNYSRGGAVPHLRHCLDRLQTIVSEKEPKIEAYRKHCTDLWLLIVADARNIQSLVIIDEGIPTRALATSFNRVFFLSAMYRICIELPLAKP
jgi:hypothetical protein